MSTITNMTQVRDKAAAMLVAWFMRYVHVLRAMGHEASAAWLHGEITRQHRLYKAANRGQMRQGLASLFVGLMIAAIIALQVFIPVVNDAIAASNISGTTQTVVELLPLFAGLLLLIALAGPLMRRT